MDILFVRHAESVGNAEARMQGHLDFPLSELGRAQVERLADWLTAQRIGWDAAYCSPLARAWQTAERIARLRPDVALEPDPDLKEIAAGALEGLTREQMQEQFPEFLRRPITALGDFEAFGGEGYDAVQVRVERVVARLVARHRPAGHRVLVVAHGGIGFQLVKRLVCEPVPRVCIVHFGNCSASLVRMRERRGAFMGELLWHVPLELMGAPTGEGIGAVFR